MELANVEGGTELVFGLLAHPADGQFPQLVGQRLPRPADVAVDFGAHFPLGQRSMARKIVDRLLPAPAVVMDTGIDDQPRSAPHLVGQAAELLVGRAIDAHLFPEIFHVETPAFAETGEIGLAAEARRLFLLQRDGTLEAVARDAFVQCKCRDIVEWSGRQIVGVHLAGIEPAPSRRIERGNGRIDRPDGEPVPGQEAEIVGQPPIDTLCGIGRYAHQFIGRARHELRIGAQKVHEFRQRAVEIGAPLYLLHLGGNSRHLVEADAVDFLCRQVESRILPDLLRVIGLAIGKFAGAEGGAGLREIFVAKEGEPVGIGRRDIVADRCTAGCPETFLFGFGNAARHVGKWLPERAFFRLVHDIGGDGDIAAFQRNPRHREPAREACFCVGGLLGEISRNVLHPADVVLVFLYRGETARGREIRPEIGIAVERHFPFGELRVADIRFQQRPQH